MGVFNKSFLTAKCTKKAQSAQSLNLDFQLFASFAFPSTRDCDFCG
jgi:hypothetical protein